MPKVLWNAPNTLFYGGKIETKEPAGGFPKLPEGWIEFIRKDIYMELLQREEISCEQECLHLLEIDGHRHMAKSTITGSHANFTSFSVVCDLVEKMQPVFGDSMNESVVILTPYRRQYHLYADKLREYRKKGWADSMLPQIAVVDNATQREWKVVLPDYVNCTEKTLGFLEDRKRACVMFTRMTAALIVVGSDISNAEWEAADVDDAESSWPLTKGSSEAFARAFAGQPVFGNRRRRNKREPLIMDMLNSFGRNGCLMPAPTPKFHPLDAPHDTLGRFDTGASKKVLHYLQNVRGLEVTSKDMLDTDTYAEYLEYRELYRSMLDKRLEAIKEGKLREFTGFVEGYETPEEVLRIERIKNKSENNEIPPWSSPVVLPRDATLFIREDGINNVASITDNVEKFSL
jgi:hypothetical protein